MATQFSSTAAALSSALPRPMSDCDLQREFGDIELHYGNVDVSVHVPTREELNGVRTFVREVADQYPAVLKYDACELTQELLETARLEYLSRTGLALTDEQDTLLASACAEFAVDRKAVA